MNKPMNERRRRKIERREKFEKSGITEGRKRT
jgi:hypothetical protein